MVSRCTKIMNKHDINGSQSSSLLQQELTVLCCYREKPNPQWPFFIYFLFFYSTVVNGLVGGNRVPQI